MTSTPNPSPLRACLLAAILLTTASVWGFQPQFEITASATNLVLTETVALQLHLRLPALAEPYENQPPILNQRPPHLEANFLEQDWKTDELAPVDAKRIFAGQAGERRRDRNAPAFSVNNYMSNDMFSSMADPFSMLDDDPFGRTMLGPRPQLFTFDISRETVNGANVWHFTATLAPWRATAAGNMKLPPARFRIPYITGVKAGHDRFGRPVNQAQIREVSLQAALPPITVLAPPAASRPSSFCGAIASNFMARATLDTNVCTAGDPLVLTLDLSGATDLSMIHPPSFTSALTGTVFRLDGSSVKTETLAHSRRFTWRVRPTKAGTIEFPALPVSYFSLATRDYVVCQTEAIPIQVKAGAQATLGALGNLEEDENVFPMPDGLELSKTGHEYHPLLPRLWLSLVLFLVPPLFVVILRLLPPVRRYLAQRNEAHRKSTAFARCKRVLQKENDAKSIQAIRRFFEVRYGVKGSTVTASDAERLMKDDYTPEERALVVEALTTQDRTTFSVHKTIVGILLLLSSCFLPTTASATDTEFTYSRAMSLATRAASEADFKKAFDAYCNCLAQGADTPSLLADIGTCALMAGDARMALAAFSCLERRTGESASSRRGIRAATARLKNDPRTDLPLNRFFARPHYIFSLDARLLVAAFAWAFLWITTLLPPGACRRILLAVFFLVFFSAGISATTSLVEEHMEKGALVHVQH